MNTTFLIIHIIHTLVWIFIVLAFLNEKTAMWNLYVIIPFIYILHCLPFHVLISAKKMIYTSEETYENKMKEADDMIFISDIKKLQKASESFCTFSPISPQGMLIFGALTCVFKLYPPNYSEIFKSIQN
jgi:hypothetical protein